MDLLSDYYPYLDVKGKSVDTIFRELCTNDIYRQIENGTWKETLINRFGNMLAEMPNVRTTANRILRDGLLARGYDVDPENVYYNIFSDYTRVGERIYHEGKTLTSCYRLTDAALMNLFKRDYDGNFYILQHWRRAGIYNVGKEGSEDPLNKNLGTCWGPHNAAFLAFEPADILEKSAGIQAEYTKEYNAYWTQYSELYHDMLADFFLMAAIKQYKAGMLSEYGFAMARKVHAKQEGVTTYWFNINTYKANDIIVMESKATGLNHTILYIPGSMVPFVEFDNVSQMKTWIVKQLSDPVTMKAFLKHFSIYNRQDGPTYTGVDNIVKGMAESSSSWDPQYYILRNPEQIPYNVVFNKVRDQVKAAMHHDAEKLVTTNAEIYRDYALGFVETMLIYTSFLDVIMPEAGIPLNIILSLTALGLSSDIAINGDSLEQRMNGVGSLANSAINTAFNMLPLFKGAGSVLKNFRRTASQIPAFADEERFIMNAFHIESKAALDNIQPGDLPIIVTHETGELRLVRLADGGQPLAVLRRVSGNKFARLNPMIFKELEGEKLISEVLSDGISRKTTYLSGSTIRGGAPYNPYEHFFDEVLTLNELIKKADKLEPVNAKYTAVKQKLGEMHTATDFDTKQQLAHELLYLLRDYRQTYPSSLRKEVLNRLSAQLKEVLYPSEISFLGRKLVEADKAMHPLVASRLYKVSQGERLGEVSSGITFALKRYAQEDPVLSISALSESAQMAIPADISYPVKYAIRDMSMANRLDIDFTLIPEYASKGFTLNEEVFKYALNKSQRVGLLTKCSIRRSGVRNVLFIGHTYDEMFSMINSLSSSATTDFGIHPHTFIRIIKGILEGGNEGEMMKQFGRKEYFDTLVRERIKNMSKNINFFDSTIFKRFDRKVQNIYEPFFYSNSTTNEGLAKMMESENGIVIKNGANEINYCRRNLDFFKNNGVTHIGISNFFADIHQSELDKFMAGGFPTPALKAVILTSDNGVSNGPLSQLLTSVRDKGMKVVALGNSESGLYSESNMIKNIYNKGVITRNAGQFLEGHKSIILADEWLINTTPGLMEPLPGLAQILEIPGFKYLSRRSTMDYIKDLWRNRYPIYIEPERDWLSIAPERGRFLGWRKFDENFQFPTPLQREEAIFSKIDHDLNGFKREYNEIRDIAFTHRCARSRHCDKTSANVRNALNAAGKHVGNGVSLSWWQRDGNEFVNQVHTAPTVIIHDKEFVVDATYIDTSGEAVVILPIDNWVEEIFNKNRGYNPYLVYRTMLGGSLAGLTNPDFTRPRLRKPRN